MSPDTDTMTHVRSTRSVLGSGQATIDTYRDADGAEWTSLSGSPATMTATAEQVALRDLRAAVSEEVAAAVRGGATHEEARALWNRLIADSVSL